MAYGKTRLHSVSASLLLLLASPATESEKALDWPAGWKIKHYEIDAGDAP
jgi:hypothetical protein